MVFILHITLFYSQQLFSCSITFFFVNILAVTNDHAAAIAAIKKEIGERLKELRESRGETLRAVTERFGGDHAFLSRLERGEANPELDTFLSLLVFGLEMDFSEFCRYLVTEDRGREHEERTARQLLEKALRRGREVRLRTIDALKVAAGESATVSKRKPQK